MGTVLKVGGALVVLAAVILAVRAVLVSKWKKARREEERRLAQRARRRGDSPEYRRGDAAPAPEKYDRPGREKNAPQGTEDGEESSAGRSGRKPEKGSGSRDRRGKYTPRH